MEKFEIFSHYEPGSDGIHQLEQTGNIEYESYRKSAETFKSEKKIFHGVYFMAASTTALTFSKISPGGSIWPYSSEQSMRMNLGSISHCF